MLRLTLTSPSERPLRVLALGAHPDDIEIGAGGTLLQLAEARPLEVRYVVMTGTAQRQDEARLAVATFLAGADVTVELHALAEGRLPIQWGEVKDILEQVATCYVPDVIFAPSVEDVHQDHRTIAEIVPTVFRNSLYLAYEIPKWDGDVWRPTVYLEMSPSVAKRKVASLSDCFASQRGRDWWGDETFLSLARLRGMECRASYAEAFACSKAVLSL